MKEIKLSQRGKNKHLNLVALVDDEDFEWLNQWKWCIIKHRNTFYARRAKDRFTLIHMHREILGISDDKSKIPDHIDKNGLNNQRSNLRIATGSQNGANQRLRKNKTSLYRGVSIRDNGKWKSEIRKDRKLHHLGYFTSEVEAAKEYNKAAKKLHGEFANLNVISS